jgi:hypothetical protein
MLLVSALFLKRHTLIYTVHNQAPAEAWLYVIDLHSLTHTFSNISPIVGVLTCLEDGCQTTIELTRLESERDGGKKGGVGSLSAFRVSGNPAFVHSRADDHALYIKGHIETHPTHKKNCLRRVKANERQKTAQVEDSSVGSCFY